MNGSPLPEEAMKAIKALGCSGGVKIPLFEAEELSHSLHIFAVIKRRLAAVYPDGKWRPCLVHGRFPGHYYASDYAGEPVIFTVWLAMDGEVPSLQVSSETMGVVRELGVSDGIY